MKAKAKFYRGIEFVQVADLSASQQILLQHNSEPERIKILIDGKIVSNCIQYHTYCEWYSTVYATSVTSTKAAAAKQEVIPVEIAVRKS